MAGRFVHHPAGRSGLVACFLWFALGIWVPPQAYATADGPDFFRAQGAPEGPPLALRAKPGATVTLGHMPPDATCVRNMGCQGGLSLQDFTTLPEDEKLKRAAAHPRWCKVQYQGMTGWVEGRHLVEAPCPTQLTTLPAGKRLQANARPLVVKDRIQGREGIDYRIRARAGQLLNVSLTATNRQTYFNLIPAGSEEAMFIGSTSGLKAQRMIPADGDYLVRVYLMRAAARRAESSRFSLQVSLSGTPLVPRAASADALVPGTPFHAKASIPCLIEVDAARTRCNAAVIRHSQDGSATLEVRWATGVRHVLFVQGKPTAWDSAQDGAFTHAGDRTILRLGTSETFEIPDALIRGG